MDVDAEERQVGGGEGLRIGQVEVVVRTVVGLVRTVVGLVRAVVGVARAAVSAARAAVSAVPSSDRAGSTRG
ncbi:hypothetical protein ACH4YO_38265 [Streptomyces noursei]|uniref:hypothetical protein n=1 Tax=Streptomyces noursei TaxID=1971 RepID=UPI0033D3D1F2